MEILEILEILEKQQTKNNNLTSVRYKTPHGICGIRPFRVG